jgi:hypothetical protein
MAPRSRPLHLRRMRRQQHKRLPGSPIPHARARTPTAGRSMSRSPPRNWRPSPVAPAPRASPASATSAMPPWPYEIFRTTSRVTPFSTSRARSPPSAPSRRLPWFAWTSRPDATSKPRWLSCIAREPSSNRKPSKSPPSALAGQHPSTLMPASLPPGSAIAREIVDAGALPLPFSSRRLQPARVRDGHHVGPRPPTSHDRDTRAKPH